MHAPFARASRPLIVFALLVLSAGPPLCRAGECYFVIVFGAQRIPNRPNYSHSFATFVRAAGDGPDAAAYSLEAHTISWLPETLDIHTFRLVPERGRNLDLHDTLDAVRAMGDRVSMWGPCQIHEELYDRARQQIGRLESGAVQYKAVDGLHRTSRTNNCIHALSDVADGQRRLRIFSPQFGEIASAHVFRRYEPWIIEPDRVYPWVAVGLGIDLEAIIPRRRAHQPRLLGVVQP